MSFKFCTTRWIYSSYLVQTLRHNDNWAGYLDCRLILKIFYTNPRNIFSTFASINRKLDSNGLFTWNDRSTLCSCVVYMKGLLGVRNIGQNSIWSSNPVPVGLESCYLRIIIPILIRWFDFLFFVIILGVRLQVALYSRKISIM